MKKANIPFPTLLRNGIVHTNAPANERNVVLRSVFGA